MTEYWTGKRRNLKNEDGRIVDKKMAEYLTVWFSIRLEDVRIAERKWQNGGQGISVYTTKEYRMFVEEREINRWEDKRIQTE
jgi:hypothetical protein